MPTTLPDASELRQQWLTAIEQVLSDIEAWACAAGWLVHRSQKSIHEEIIGTYAAPTLQIKTPPGHLMVEPVALSVFGGADGRIDVYAWPSLHRVKLVRIDGQWRARTDSGIDWPKAWSRETFLELAEELTAAM